jgi:thiamine biosynthesis lipoprotein
MRLQMGSLTEITVPAAMYTPAAVSRAFDTIDRLDALLSTYKPDSEVSRLARSGSLRVSPEFMEIAARSIEWAERTEGAFNPMLGPVIALWRHAAETQRLPEPEVLEAARQLADFRRARLNAQSSTIAFPEAGMGFDFGAIGKGFAVDQAAESLRRDGVIVVLAASGGSSHRLIGLPPGQDCWELGIRHPEDAEQAVAILRMGEGGLATSAQSGQPLDIAGHRYGHILDPRTGWPAEPPDPLWSASVVGPEATGADALSTALVAMGAARAMALIESLPGFEALLIRRGETGSPAFTHSSGLRRAGTVEGLPVFVPAGASACRGGLTGQVPIAPPALSAMWPVSRINPRAARFSHHREQP